MFNIKKNKKGNEKTIEIFVALFLILAVAMVLLRMFSGQIADRSAALDRLDEKQTTSAKCGELCAQANNNKCRIEDKIQFCTSKYQLDLDENNRIGVYDSGAYQLCEDNIYCPLQQNCVCGVELDMQECIEITYEYYENTGFSSNETEEFMKEAYKFSDGACEVDDTGSRAWNNLFGRGYGLNTT